MVKLIFRICSSFARPLQKFLYVLSCRGLIHHHVIDVVQTYASQLGTYISIATLTLRTCFKLKVDKLGHSGTLSAEFLFRIIIKSLCISPDD